MSLDSFLEQYSSEKSPKESSSSREEELAKPLLKAVSELYFPSFLPFSPLFFNSRTLLI
jgi:hypothetical protein